ncbi:MAG: hypothetical protein R3E01_22685 [Pirellulaceae bacterium]|nr:hypothetical protein [Planctomycetales bacterium]
MGFRRPSGVRGDYNGNGVADAADYTVWKDTFGSHTALAADGSGNGIVDAADYTVWKDDFGATEAAVSAAAVPEPSGVFSQLLMMFTVAWMRKRQRLHRRV